MNKSNKYSSIASVLFFISAILAVVWHHISNKQEPMVRQLLVEAFIIITVGGVALLIRKEYQWVRWLLLSIVLLSIYTKLVSLIYFLTLPVVVRYLQIIQITLQFTAVVLLFRGSSQGTHINEIDKGESIVV